MALRRKRLFLIGGVVALALILLMLGWRYQAELARFFAEIKLYRRYILRIRHLGPYAFLGFGVVVALMTLIPGAPASAVALIAGGFLGHWLGFAVNSVGLIVGNLVQAQLFTVIDRRHGARVNSRVYQFLIKMRRPALGMVIGYAVPMIPTAFVNAAASATHVPQRTRVGACVLGSTIVAFIYAFAGDLLVVASAWQGILALLTLAIVVAVFEYEVHLRRKSFSSK
ncbi:VTT domain-containing protein [Lapidilactobacillus achengensis]|uniref:VTT domain-containing protein n=1 Tax=Lapidilactobacillus achengensis TaxID=2486000 RepID=A0ABW1UPN3_9LACO|nr:VTT domain-containing protein [Lapidilactobacillus achengensis]